MSSYTRSKASSMSARAKPSPTSSEPFPLRNRTWRGRCSKTLTSSTFSRSARRRYLQQQGLSRGQYNQIANFVMAQSEVNIAIGDKPPEVYFKEIAGQVNSGPKRYGGITDPEVLRQNFGENCLPESLLNGQVPNYETFLTERRRLMSLCIKRWFEVL